MKKSVLSLAVAAGVMGVMSGAHADMYINDNGLGEALIYPFYSAQNGNDTYIHVVNTTADSKAVKVRILEAQNSQEVIDFNVYMSPDDHFSFAITATADGGAELRTVDNTCTVPAIPTVGDNAYKSVEFRGFQYRGDFSLTAPVFDNTGIERTQVGYIEVIEMGQVVDGSAFDIDLTHGASGVPADCADLVESWTAGGAWASDGGKGSTNMQTSWNGGGLYGFGTVINVADGTSFGYDAVAIDGLVEAGQNGYALHYPPGDTRPDFTDDALATTAITEVDGQSVLSTYDAGEEVLTVGHLFMTTELYNDFIIDDGLNATTDWVITQPTKAFHVQTAPTVVPYSTVWNGRSACEFTALTSVDREESFVGPDAVDFSPPPPVVSDDLPLCYETTLVQFAETSATNSDTVVVGVNDALEATEGWAVIDFRPTALSAQGQASIASHGRVLAPLSGVAQTGLPLTGFAAVTYTNGVSMDGALRNYAFSTEHKSFVVTSAVGSP